MLQPGQSSVEREGPGRAAARAEVCMDAAGAARIRPIAASDRLAGADGNATCRCKLSGRDWREVLLLLLLLLPLLAIRASASAWDGNGTRASRIRCPVTSLSSTCDELNTDDVMTKPCDDELNMCRDGHDDGLLNAASCTT